MQVEKACWKGRDHCTVLNSVLKNCVRVSIGVGAALGLNLGMSYCGNLISARYCGCLQIVHAHFTDGVNFGWHRRAGDN
jgi:hypothetical protein